MSMKSALVRRLQREANPEARRVFHRSGSHYRVCIDFDGVLHAYTGWKGTGHTSGPVPGALAFVQELVAEQYEVVVFTTRPADVVTAWLECHGFPALEVTDKKPSALVYIDDKAHRFTGDWVAAAINTSKSYTMKPLLAYLMVFLAFSPTAGKQWRHLSESQRAIVAARLQTCAKVSALTLRQLAEPRRMMLLNSQGNSARSGTGVDARRLSERTVILTLLNAVHATADTLFRSGDARFPEEATQHNHQE